MGARASVRTPYDYSESTDITPEDVANAMRLVDAHGQGAGGLGAGSAHYSPSGVENKALSDVLASPCFFKHPFVDYRFEKKIGSGAFSNVYKASQMNGQGQVVMTNANVHKDPDRPKWRPVRYAIKEMLLQTLSSQQLLNVEREVQILSQLHHPDIVHMQSVYLYTGNAPAGGGSSRKLTQPQVGRGLDLVSRKGKDAQLFIVLEYLSGGELLNAVCKRQRYTEDDARELLKQIFSGIQNIHSRGVIHRDIKPENLILAKKSMDSRIKIVDFGFATLIDDQEELHQEGERIRERSNSLELASQPFQGAGLTPEQKKKHGFLCGTPGYIAPEVLSHRHYTTKCDMWAAGVVVYILLSGTMPFAINDTKSVLGGAYSFPASHWQQVSDLAKDFIRGLLCVDPVSRYSADEALAHTWMNTTSATIDLLDGDTTLADRLSAHPSLAELDEDAMPIPSDSSSRSVSASSHSSNTSGTPGRKVSGTGSGSSTLGGAKSVSSSRTDSGAGAVSKNPSVVGIKSTGELTQNLKYMHTLTIRSKFRAGLTAVRAGMRFQLGGQARERRRSESAGSGDIPDLKVRDRAKGEDAAAGGEIEGLERGYERYCDLAEIDE